MPARQYVAVKFPNSRRTYTYHNDGPPVAVGDKVKIEGKNGWTACAVVTIDSMPPTFETKAIAGIIEPPQRDLLSERDGDDLNNEKGHT